MTHANQEPPTGRLTAEDHEKLDAILSVADLPTTLAALVYDYYRDRDRADRTPRTLIYLHLGMLTGALQSTLDARPRLVPRPANLTNG